MITFNLMNKAMGSLMVWAMDLRPLVFVDVDMVVNLMLESSYINNGHLDSELSFLPLLLSDGNREKVT